MTAFFLLLAIAGQAPPIVAIDTPEARSPALLAFRPGEARCGAGVETPPFADPPLPAALEFAPASFADGEVRLSFRIAPDGRPLGISVSDGPAMLRAQGSDLAPALASWRFAPGAERRDCEITFTATMSPVETASLADLQRAMLLARPGTRFKRVAWRRLHPEPSTCERPPQPRSRSYPAFERIAQPPGTAAYSLVGFDVDAAGRPTRVRIVGTSGNDELDRRSLEAIRRSRYRPEAKQGCDQPFWHHDPAPLAAPPPPDPKSLRPAGSTCATNDEPWADLPPLQFPNAFQRRLIEGWAIIGYDRAPWGATGNVRMLAAEPAAEFGERALAIVRSARTAASATGATGCVDRVVFRVEQDPDAAAPDD